MLLADKAIREEGSRKVYISGIFDQISAREFPTRHDTMSVYLALTDGKPGDHTGQLNLVYIDSPAEHPGTDPVAETDLVSMSGPLQFPKDKLAVIELIMELRGIVFPRPGTLQLRFSVDGSLIVERTFRVTLSKPEDNRDAR